MSIAGVCVFGSWLNWPHLAQLEFGVGGATASPGPVRVWGGWGLVWAFSKDSHKHTFVFGFPIFCFNNRLQIGLCQDYNNLIIYNRIQYTGLYVG